MYPGTIFNWHDNSGIETTTSSNEIVAPLLMQVFSADKGTEDLIEISGKDFDAMYGKMSFERHGQSAIQAKAIIDAGGRLFAKRVVAEDSTLANVVLVANVSSAEDGKVTVTWESKSITGCKTFEEVKKQAEALLDESAGVFPVFVFTDNGRGESVKAVRINPDYSTSKSVGKTFYTLNVYEGTNVIEQTTITVDPSVIYGGVAYRLDKYTNIQVSGVVVDTVFDAYAEAIANALVLDIDTIRNYDIVYGYTNKGNKIEGFTIGDDSIDLDAPNGILLTEGSNGAFGKAPVGTTAWANAIKEVFVDETGKYDEVYDVDQHKIAAICDANYPDEVKHAIYDFVEFRKDCVFLRDYGLDCRHFADIAQRKIDMGQRRNFFTMDYATSYQVLDPNTFKNIEVTCTYDIAPILVGHILNNPYAPLAGQVNGFVLKNAIKGTINFTPVITPKANQKESMDELHVNYAIFEDNDCVVQSCYTSQDEYTQLTYGCNVVAIQRVLRAIRTACPRQRYALSTGTDLQAYATAVNNVLSNFTSNFAELNFVYSEDPLKVNQRIFYASIEFAFLGWAQTEIFDIYAINS